MLANKWWKLIIKVIVNETAQLMPYKFAIWSDYYEDYTGKLAIMLKWKTNNELA